MNPVPSQGLLGSLPGAFDVALTGLRVHGGVHVCIHLRSASARSSPGDQAARAGLGAGSRRGRLAPPAVPLGRGPFSFLGVWKGPFYTPRLHLCLLLLTQNSGTQVECDVSCPLLQCFSASEQ